MSDGVACFLFAPKDQRRVGEFEGCLILPLTPQEVADRIDFIIDGGDWKDWKMERRVMDFYPPPLFAP